MTQCWQSILFPEYLNLKNTLYSDQISDLRQAQMGLAQPIWQQTHKTSTRCLITWEPKPNDYSIWQKNKHSLLSLRSYVSSVKHVLIINLFNIHSASAGDNLEPFTQINSHRGRNALKCSGWISQTRFRFQICFSLGPMNLYCERQKYEIFPSVHCVNQMEWV